MLVRLMCANCIHLPCAGLSMCWASEPVRSCAILCQQLVRTKCRMVPTSPVFSTQRRRGSWRPVWYQPPSLLFPSWREMETSKSEAPAKSIWCVNVYKHGSATRSCTHCKSELVSVERYSYPLCLPVCVQRESHLPRFICFISCVWNQGPDELDTTEDSVHCHYITFPL